MIKKIIRLSTNYPWIVVALFTFFSFLTVVNLKKIPLDALPDLSENQVIVFTEWTGRSPSLIEDQITYPLVTSLLSTPSVKYVRAVSMFGASQISVVFEDKVDLYWARSRIAEKLLGTQNLPKNVTPILAPDATGLGWVFQYALVDHSGKQDLSQLRSLQDWNLRFALQAVPGVAEIATVGGFVKEYQIQLNPTQLQAFNLSPLQVIKALRDANQESGNGVIEMAGSEYVVRGRGYIKSLAEIEKTPLEVTKGGRVVKVADVAVVTLGPAPRTGVSELDGEGEAVGGIVVMRVGENALKTIESVKEKIASIKASLPPGVEIIPVYDRSHLILNAIKTLKKVLSEEIIIVSLIVSLFLWHARASFVAIIPLPLAVLFSFLPMFFTKYSANIMSLGGIALAIGAMVDSGIILVENAHKKLEGLDTSQLPEKQRRKFITEAMLEMGKPLFLSLLVITVSFLPIFFLEGREGKLFQPLAYTKTASMACSAFLAISLIPALAILFLKGRFLSEEKHKLTNFLHKIYTPIIYFVLKSPRIIIACALVLMVSTIPIIFKMQSEFMPPLNEGTILYMPTSLPGMSIDTAIELLQKQNTIIKQMPEVDHVFGKSGRSSSPTDPAPLNMFESVITLKPSSQWREGMTFEKIISELDNKLNFPGIPNIWWMPIQTRIEMLSTGVRTALGLKVTGANLKDVQDTATKIEETLKSIPETKSVFAERIATGNYLDVHVHRETAALYGLNVNDIFEILEVITGNQISSVFIDGRERYSMKVLYAKDFRNDLKALENVLIPTPTGTQVKLKHVASLSLTQDPPMITTENGKILGLVFVDIDKKTGIANYVEKAKTLIGEKIKIPVGVEIIYSGQYESYERAKNTLKIIVPVTLCIILFLLFLITNSLVETGIVFLAVPFSLVGAFWLLYLLNYKLSIATWVGIIALAGLDAETGVVMLLYLTRAWDKTLIHTSKPLLVDLKNAIYEGAVKRVRPKLMTVMAAFVGLLPVMWSTGTGAEVMKRIAAPMVGGIFTSGLLELLVYPALFFIWKKKKIAYENAKII